MTLDSKLRTPSLCRYNYDVALDRPLEGRFEWVPLPLTGGSEGVKPSQSVR